MVTRARMIVAVLGAAMGLLATLVPVASAVVVRGRHGHFLGVALHHGITAASIPGSVAATRPSRASSYASSTPSPLQWNNGPVVHSSAPYLIFWTPAGQTVPSAWASLMQQYLTDVAADSAKGAAANVFGVIRQYTDGTGFADFKQSFDPAKQVISDTDPYPTTPDATCGGASTSASCVTDTQLQGEISHLISTDHLPTAGTGTDQISANAPIYLVVLPPNVDICVAGTSCAHNSICAYHADYQDGADNVLYAAIPTMPLNTNPKVCQADGNRSVQEPNGNIADVALKYLNHENIETITDPLGDGWYDTRTGNETADNCNDVSTDTNAFRPVFGTSPALYTQTINAHHYYLQSEWSNGENNCDMRPSGATVSPHFTASPSAPENVSAISFDPSASTGGPYTSATWNWGDGTASEFYSGETATEDRQHTYASGGTYTVSLTLVDALGNTATSAQPLTVYPTASFTAAPAGVNPGQPVTFTASASDPGGTITTYSWDYGDGSSTGSGATASHSYSAAGVYTVTLNVTDSRGGTATVTHEITVGPIAAFTSSPAQPVETQTVSFDAGGSNPGPGSKFTSYAWDFGDGTQGSGKTATHPYASPGQYTVKLTVTNDQTPAQTASTTETVTVGEDLPVPAFTSAPPSPQVAQPVAFSASAADPAGQAVTYSWDFGDGTPPSTIQSPAHSYTDPGRYAVTLTVKNSLGRSASISETVVVQGLPPTAAFAVASSSTALAGQPVAFDAGASSDPYNVPLTYTWNFGDGTTATGSATSHTFGNPGSYTVWLTVSDPSGQSATVSQLLSVHAPPTAAFSISPATAREGTAVSFDGSRSFTRDPSMTIAGYRWSFGDGSTGSGAAASHSYAHPGVYTAQLTVSDGLGQSGTSSQQVTVTDEPPSAAVAVTTAHPASGHPVGFSAAGSSDPDGAIVSYRWSFGDGATAAGGAPSHSFARPGRYSVTLTVIDSAGQSAATSASVTVVASGRITKLAIRAARQGATVLVSVNTAGRLTAGRRAYLVRRAGTVKVPVALSAAQLRHLARTHQVKVRLALRFTALAGPPAAETRSLIFHTTRLNDGRLAVVLGR